MEDSFKSFSNKNKFDDNSLSSQVHSLCNLYNEINMKNKKKYLKKSPEQERDIQKKKLEKETIHTNNTLEFFRKCSIEYHFQFYDKHDNMLKILKEIQGVYLKKGVHKSLKEFKENLGSELEKLTQKQRLIFWYIFTNGKVNTISSENINKYIKTRNVRRALLLVKHVKDKISLTEDEQKDLEIKKEIIEVMNDTEISESSIESSSSLSNDDSFNANDNIKKEDKKDESEELVTDFTN